MTHHSPNRGGVVLLVCDDSGAAAALAATVEAAGYRPLLAPDGATGLALVAVGVSRLRLVILDLRLDGGRAVAFARQLLNFRPGLPLIVVLAPGDGAPEALVPPGALCHVVLRRADGGEWAEVAALLGGG